MVYSDFAIDQLLRRLAEAWNRTSTPRRLAGDLLEAVEVIRQLRTKAVPPPNEPLTLEELREMDGEPVWTVAIDSGVSRWTFIDSECELVRFFTTRRGVACEGIARYFKAYGKTWLAYRRRPEEGAQ